MVAAIPFRLAWTSPFAKWGGTLSEISSIDLATAVTTATFAARGFEPARLHEVVLGWTVPQRGIFYGPSTLATKIGAPGIAGPMISQACATSVAALRESAQSVQCGTAQTSLAVLTDRTSNSPLLVYPRPSGPGGSPATENWLLDAFARDPGTGKSMLATADAVAAEEGISRDEIDDAAALRYSQYSERSGRGDHVTAVSVPGKRNTLKLDADEGVRLSTREELGALPAAAADGVHSFGSQTHPADGTAGAVVTSVENARGLSDGHGVIELLGFGGSRVNAARMPKAPVPAAQAALSNAGKRIDDIDLVATHNPFAVNDVYFSRETGFPLDRMNTYGCSLVFGHPQGPTGMRSIVELASALRERGGGIGLFTGCAAGDVGAAVVVRVDD